MLVATVGVPSLLKSRSFARPSSPPKRTPKPVLMVPMPCHISDFVAVAEAS